MLKENINARRKSKGLSQEELAIKLNVVRQTISKWEQGLSVPDSEMLISISEVLETPVGTLLGETISESKIDDIKAISEKLEIINLQLSQRIISQRKKIHWLFILLCAVKVIISVILIVFNSSYLDWNFSNPETAVVGTILHAFEWLYVRLAPIFLIGGILGIVLTRKKV
ncbi:MAG: helix-turn-helix domain-containing protein [Bacilli bacterium]